MVHTRSGIREAWVGGYPSRYAGSLTPRTAGRASPSSDLRSGCDIPTLNQRSAQTRLLAQAVPAQGRYLLASL